MPIRPENRARYPKNWPAIGQSIRKRARNRCECHGECGLLHHITPSGGQLDLPPAQQPQGLKPRRCTARNGKPHPATGSIVVLTVAHLDQQPENVDYENLKAMCQRCHNRLDMPHRKRGIAERRRAKLAAGDLFPGAK